MADSITQVIAGTRADATSLSAFTNLPAGATVTRRLAPNINTLDFYIANITTTVNDAINNTAISGGVVADTLVTATANGTNKVARTQRDVNSDVSSVRDYGAKGNGIANDSLAFINSPDGIYVPDGVYKLDSDAKGRIINPSNGATFTGAFANTIKMPFKFADKVPIRNARNLLFIGDSLTEKRDNTSYAWYVANDLAQRHGGYAQIGYLPFSSYRTKYDVGNITVANVGMTEMYGASDGKWATFPYVFSPDGKGWHVTNASGSENITITLGSNLRFSKVKVYALQTPNSGTFNISMVNTPDKDKLNYSLVAATSSVKVIEVAPDASEGFSKITINGLQAGKDYYFFGIEILDNTNSGGFTYNVFARNGRLALDFAELTSIGKYIEQITPDTALINLGTNDVMNGRTVGQYKANMTTLIDRIKAASPATQIVIVEPNQTNLFANSNLHHEFAIARKELAKEVGGYYIDVPAIAGDYKTFNDAGYINSDGVHPNALGKKVIAEAVLKGLNVPVTNTAFYYPVQREFSHLHSISGLGRYETLPLNVKKSLFSIGLYGAEADSIVTLTITAQLFGSCVTKEVTFYARKYMSWVSGTVSIVNDVVVVDKYKSPASTTNNFDVFVETDDTKAVISITPRNWSPTTWTASGTYTTKLKIPKNSGLVIT